MADNSIHKPKLPGVRTLHDEMSAHDEAEMGVSFGRVSKQTLTNPQPVVSTGAEARSEHDKHLFDVGRAIEDDHVEVGTFVTDKRRRRLHIGTIARSALSEWWGNVRKTLKKIEAFAAPEETETITLKKAEARKDVITQASELSKLAPRDDHKVVVENIKTLAHDAERLTGNAYRIKKPKPYSNATPTWKSATEPKPPVTPTTTEKPATEHAAPNVTITLSTEAAKPLVKPALAKAPTEPEFNDIRTMQRDSEDAQGIAHKAPAAPKTITQFTQTPENRSVGLWKLFKQRTAQKQKPTVTVAPPIPKPISRIHAPTTEPVVRIERVNTTPTTKAQPPVTQTPINTPPRAPKRAPEKIQTAKPDTKELSKTSAPLDEHVPETKPDTEPVPVAPVRKPAEPTEPQLRQTPELPTDDVIGERIAAPRASSPLPKPAHVSRDIEGPPAAHAPLDEHVPETKPDTEPVPVAPVRKPAEPQLRQTPELPTDDVIGERIAAPRASSPLPKPAQKPKPKAQKTRLVLTETPYFEFIDEEQTKPQTTPQDALPPTPAAEKPRAKPTIRWTTNRLTFAALLVAVVIGGAGAGIYTGLRYSANQAVNLFDSSTVAVEGLFRTDRSVAITVTGDAASIAEKIRAEIIAAPAGTTHIYGVITDEKNREVVVDTASFIKALGWRLESRFLRVLDSVMMIGSVYTDTNEPFIILRSSNFDVTFPGMLVWERVLREDLTPIFGFTGETTSQPFTDALLNNQSIRVLTNENGAEEIVYTFVDRSTIIITSSSVALATIIDAF